MGCGSQKTTAGIKSWFTVGHLEISPAVTFKVIAVFLLNLSSMEQVNKDTLFLQPQEISVQLRPGVRQSFLITVTRPLDQPMREVTMDASIVPWYREYIQENKGTNILHNGGWRLCIHYHTQGVKCSVYLCVCARIGLVSLGQCECTKTRQESSLACSVHGALVCGRSECYEPCAGQRCHNNLDSLSQNDDACRLGPGNPVCSNRGSCVEGFCECNQRENPGEKYCKR